MEPARAVSIIYKVVHLALRGQRASKTHQRCRCPPRAWTMRTLALSAHDGKLVPAAACRSIRAAKLRFLPVLKSTILQAADRGCFTDAVQTPTADNGGDILFRNFARSIFSSKRSYASQGVTNLACRAVFRAWLAPDFFTHVPGVVTEMLRPIKISSSFLVNTRRT